MRSKANGRIEFETKKKTKFKFLLTTQTKPSYDGVNVWQYSRSNPRRFCLWFSHVSLKTVCSYTHYSPKVRHDIAVSLHIHATNFKTSWVSAW